MRLETTELSPPGRDRTRLTDGVRDSDTPDGALRPEGGGRPTRWRQGSPSERIDVRRGDLPYERVVGYDLSPGLRPAVTLSAVRSVDEPGGGSA